ncbi:MAG: tRNA (adenosine(37)-N6)-dimethylallyltransferase MiaA [Nitriliruptoraceae bacterium]
MPLLALVGPTAGGKSAAALQAARARVASGQATEIVAVDAFTVYRGMDIGTATPSPADRGLIPHHLVDVLEPHEELSVAAFRARARAAIDEIRGRGATPLLVGGSGLYFRAVVDPLRFPPTDPVVRARIEDRWRSDAVAAHAHLRAQDPAAAERIEPGNLRRTVRALEVLELTGVPFSSFDDGYDRYDSIYPDLEVVLLDPGSQTLRERIRDRAERMVQAGLVEELARLRADGPLSRTAAQAIGYAEAAAVLDGLASREDLAERIARRTWRYARRQRSWFRADPRAVPVSSVEEAVARLLRR